MSTTKYTTFNFFKNIAEYFIPVATQSHFHEKGVLTPEEFVTAGDLLVSKCPTWQWSKAVDSSKRKDYLPENKQFLITKNVPCLKRAKTLELEAEDETGLEDDWVATHTKEHKNDEDIETIDSKKQSSSKQTEQDDEDDDDIMDMNDYQEDENEIEGTDDAVATNDSNKHNDLFLKTRTYDISITYDKFYQTPRVWLFGYDENGKPLDPKKTLEDIHADYSLKTVTIEQHPSLNSQWASIHPCRHAEVMKKMIDRSSSDGKVIRVDLYLFLFLKFISAVIPTIEYDYSISA